MHQNPLLKSSNSTENYSTRKLLIFHESLFLHLKYFSSVKFTALYELKFLMHSLCRLQCSRKRMVYLWFLFFYTLRRMRFNPNEMCILAMDTFSISLIRISFKVDYPNEFKAYTGFLLDVFMPRNT